MSDRTENGNDSSNEPEPVSSDRRPFLVRLWDNGIPLWQKLLVWAGALGVAWTILASFILLRALGALWSAGPMMMHDEERIPPVAPTPTEVPLLGWLAVSLALSFGFWAWPLTRGCWRALALALAAPATFGILILFPLIGPWWLSSIVDAVQHPDRSIPFWPNAILPPFVYVALFIVWIGPFRAWRARRAGPTD